MTADAFLRALRRFIARRGIPNLVSDNFQTFRKVAAQLEAVSKIPQVQNYCASKHIVWEFIREYLVSICVRAKG